MGRVAHLEDVGFDDDGGCHSTPHTTPHHGRGGIKNDLGRFGRGGGGFSSPVHTGPRTLTAPLPQVYDAFRVILRGKATGAWS